MPSLNRVTLIGHLGQDPELSYTKGGKPVARISIATTDGSKDKPVTSWHSCIGWQKTAELWQKYLRKGQAIYVEGRINYEKYEDKKTGQSRYFTRIVCDRFIMLGGKAENSASVPANVPQETNIDDVPF